MAELDWSEIQKRLQEKFCKPSTYPGRGNQPMQYIKGPDVQNHLDNVVGAGNWQTQFRVLEGAPVWAVECTLIIHGVQRADVGLPNNPENPEEEAVKSAYTDALKRVASQFGVGRWLRPGSGGIASNEEKQEAQRRGTSRDVRPRKTQPPAKNGTAFDRGAAMARFPGLQRQLEAAGIPFDPIKPDATDDEVRQYGNQLLTKLSAPPDLEPEEPFDEPMPEEDIAPRRTTQGNMQGEATPKQLGLIEKLVASKGEDMDLWRASSKQEASDAIGRLMDMPDKGQAQPDEQEGSF